MSEQLHYSRENRARRSQNCKGGCYVNAEICAKTRTPNWITKDGGKGHEDTRRGLVHGPHIMKKVGGYHYEGRPKI